MKESIQEKLNLLKERYEEVAALLSEPEIIQDQARFRDLSKEYAQLEPIAQQFSEYQATVAALAETELLLRDSDEQVRLLAQEELPQLKEQLKKLEEDLTVLLIPQDPDDQRDVFIEIRAGTGGNEAAIFAGDLFRMYSRYAENQGWRMEVVSANPAEHGGYKEIIAKCSGNNVYAKLKFESGVHRVQRVPVTESQGRIHTSTCTVAILPEVGEVEAITINPSELRIDTYRASGAGGQHVNRTDSAVRITHIPSGLVVECQDERSQHKNKARAMAILQAKLLDIEKRKQETEQAETRRSLVGSGDRSERIRTYNYPQGRVTDHRINLTLYTLDEVMEGQLDGIIEPLTREHQADQLAATVGE